MQIESAKELDVYQLANEFAMEIFEITKNVSKLWTVMVRTARLIHLWIFAKQCGYISPEQHHALTGKCAEIGRMLGGMIKKSESFLVPE